MQRWAHFWAIALSVALHTTASTTKPRRSLFVSKHGHAGRGLEQFSNGSLDEGERGLDFGGETGKTDAAKDLFDRNPGFPGGNFYTQMPSSFGQLGNFGSSAGYPQPKLGSSIGYQPRLGSSIGYQPGLGSSIGYQPGLGSSIGYQPGLGSSIGYQPSLGPSVGYQPSLGPSVGYQPNLGPSIGYQPNLGPSIGYQPSLGPSIGYQPSLGPSIGYQPSLGPSIGYQPGILPLGQSSGLGHVNNFVPVNSYKPAVAGQLPPIIRPSSVSVPYGTSLPLSDQPFFGSSSVTIPQPDSPLRSYASAARALGSALQAQLAADGSDNAARAYISPGTYYPTFQGNPFAPPPFFGPPTTPTGSSYNAIPVDLTDNQPINLIPQQQLPPVMNLVPQQQLPPVMNLVPQQQLPPVMNLVPQQQLPPVMNLVPQQPHNFNQQRTSNLIPQQHLPPVMNLFPQQPYNFNPQRPVNLIPQQTQGMLPPPLFGGFGSGASPMGQFRSPFQSKKELH